MEVSVTISGIDVESNGEALDALYELMKSAGGTSVTSGESAEQSVSRVVADDSEVAEKKVKRTRKTKKKAEKIEVTEVTEEEEELTDDEEDRLNDLSETELRNEIKDLVGKFKTAVGLGPLKELIKKAGGADGNKVKPSLIPVKNLVATCIALSEGIEGA